MALDAITQKEVDNFITKFLRDNPNYVWMKTTDDSLIFCNKKTPVMHLLLMTANWNVNFKRWDVVQKCITGPLCNAHWLKPYDGRMIYHYIPTGKKWWKKVIV